MTVTNASGQGLVDERMALASSDASENIGPIIDAGNRNSATITASTTAAPATITATDSSVAPAASKQATLTQVAPKVTLSLKPTTIPGNGTAATVATMGVHRPGGAVPVNGSPMGWSDPGRESVPSPTMEMGPTPPPSPPPPPRARLPSQLPIAQSTQHPRVARRCGRPNHVSSEVVRSRTCAGDRPQTPRGRDQVNNLGGARDELTSPPASGRHTPRSRSRRGSTSFSVPGQTESRGTGTPILGLAAETYVDLTPSGVIHRPLRTTRVAPFAGQQEV